MFWLKHKKSVFRIPNDEKRNKLISPGIRNLFSICMVSSFSSSVIVVIHLLKRWFNFILYASIFIWITTWDEHISIRKRFKTKGGLKIWRDAQLKIQNYLGKIFKLLLYLGWTIFMEHSIQCCKKYFNLLHLIFTPFSLLCISLD